MGTAGIFTTEFTENTEGNGNVDWSKPRAVNSGHFCVLTSHFLTFSPATDTDTVNRHGITDTDTDTGSLTRTRITELLFFEIHNVLG